MAQTESTLATLSSQVSQLADLVKAALPQTKPVPNPQSTFSPFEDSQPSIGSQGGVSPTSSDGTIAALTQQVSALSTSVAQLQRLQQTQTHNSRQNSFTRPSLGDRFASVNGMARPLRTDRNLVSGPLTTPVARIVSPSPSGLPNGSLLTHAPSRDFSPPIRPHTTRTVSNSVALTGLPGGENDKWGPPSFNLNAVRDWSPGPGRFGRADPPSLTPGNTLLNGQTTPGGFFQPNGPATPGVVLPGNTSGVPGAVVTRWDQLNLKLELVRSIGKYG